MEHEAKGLEYINNTKDPWLMSQVRLFEIEEKEANVRNYTAAGVIGAFMLFFILSLCFGFWILYRNTNAQENISSFKELVISLSAICASPVSAVIGYYFKDIKSSVSKYSNTKTKKNN